MRQRDGVVEEQRPAVVVVVAVVALDQLVAHVGDELADVEPQPRADGGDVAHERLLQVGALADAQSGRLRETGEGARGEVEPESRLAGVRDGLLHDQLRDVDAEGVRAVVEVAEAVRLAHRLVQVVDVPERGEGVGLDVTKEARHGLRGGGGRVLRGGGRCRIARRERRLRGRDVRERREGEH